MFEGIPNFPTTSRFWEVIDKHKVNIFYTAPTAIRALMREGEAPVKKTSRSSLAPLGIGRRADQSGGVALVSPSRRRRPLSGRGYVVADGDGRNSDLAAAGCDRFETGVGDETDVRHRACDHGCDGKHSRRCWKRKPRAARVMAGPDAHRVRRPHAVREHVLQDLSRHVLHGRRLPSRRGRLLLDHGARGRRYQRIGPPARHGRGGIGAGRESQGRRSGGGRISRTTSRARESTRMSRSRSEKRRPRRWQTISRNGSVSRSVLSRAPTSSNSRRVCRRRGPEKSCGGFCARSRKTTCRTLAIRRHWPIHRWSTIW